MTTLWVKRVVVCLLVVFPAQEVAAQCNRPIPPPAYKSNNKAKVYYLDPIWSSDGQSFGDRPGAQTSTCIAEGLAVWHGHNGVTVSPSGSPNVFVTRDDGWVSPWLDAETTSYGDVLSEIKAPLNFVALTGNHCLRVSKVMAHEMGHALGLGHVADHAPNAFLSLMKQVINGLFPWGDIDLHPLFPSCGDDQGIEEAGRYEGPPPVQWSGWGGPMECTPGGFSDEGTCCHIAALSYAPAVGHLNRKPISHIRSPANNTSYAPGSTVTFNLHTMDTDGSVYRVDYLIREVFANGTFGNQFTVSGGGYPFGLSWANVPPGTTWEVEAAAYDTAQEYTVSEKVRVSIAAPPTNTPNNLLSGVILYPNQTRVSPNGLYTLIYQTNGNLVFYGPSGPLIQTGTSGVAGGTYMSPTGNLEVYNAGPTLVWQSNTAGGSNGGAHLTVRNDGKVALVRTNGTTIVQWP